MSDAELDRAVRFPSLVRPRWVKEMYVKWGPNSPNFQSRVLGQFPSQGQSSVFPAEAVQRAARPVTEEQWKEAAQWTGVIQVGLDVAGAGDDEGGLRPNWQRRNRGGRLDHTGCQGTSLDVPR